MEQRKIEYTIVDINSVETHPKNVRQGDIGAISESLKAHGQYRPIVVDKRTNRILAGNHTWKAAKALGWQQINAGFIETKDDEEALRILLADNRTTDLASYDDSGLAELLKQLADTEIGLEGTAFDGDDLDALLKDLGHFEIPTDADEIPQDVPAISSLGDVWLLGDHRIMCGDSTNPEQLKKLFNGQIVQMCFTSPPYALNENIKLSGNKSMSKKQSAYQKHFDNPDIWLELMHKWFDESIPFVSDIWLINLQMLANNKRDLISWINDKKIRLIDIVTWNKGHAAPAMASGVLTSQFEWIIGLGKENATRSFPLSSWRGNTSNVYDAPPQRNNENSNIHGATMPIHLPIWILTNLCDETKSVFDPFMGTGTTLIAAEMCKIKSFGMELDPQYVDVICARYQKHTGNQPILEATGEAHDFNADH